MADCREVLLLNESEFESIAVLYHVYKHLSYSTNFRCKKNSFLQYSRANWKLSASRRIFCLWFFWIRGQETADEFSHSYTFYVYITLYPKKKRLKVSKHWKLYNISRGELNPRN